MVLPGGKKAEAALSFIWVCFGFLLFQEFLSTIPRESNLARAFMTALWAVRAGLTERRPGARGDSPMLHQTSAIAEVFCYAEADCPNNRESNLARQ